MQQAEIFVLLFALVAGLVIVARKLALPYPIVLVLAGLAISFVPHLPQVKLNPETVFYFFLPPLIFPAALFTSWRDFRRNLRPILLLAIGLVLATMFSVACIAHVLVPDMPWAAAFALGAIVSPPDAVAATAIVRRLGVPHNVEVVLEGESLVNDATALVALQFAIAALVTGQFSLGAAAGRFVLVAVGGTAFGLLVGFVMRWIHRHLDDPPVQMIISLVTPFVAYLGAERLHLSGVLAVVAAGIYLGWHSPVSVSARFRLQAFSVWEVVAFLLNGFVFLVIGLQLPGILSALRDESLVRLISDALLVSAVAVLVRLAWVFIGARLQGFFHRCCKELSTNWRNVAVLGWSGMRGVISLAAAFALPLTLADGHAFPARNYILFLTFAVILTTLVLQGLTLPVLIRVLHVKAGSDLDDEERSARMEANRAALTWLAERANDGVTPNDAVERLRAEYEERLEQLRATADTPEGRRGEVMTPRYQRLQMQALQHERETIIRLRNEHVINDQALRRIQRDLDLAEARLDHG